MRRALICVAVALTAACFGEAAVADRLVLADGSVVETEGPWRVEGRMVVFNAPNGTLSSLRLDAVDLEASEAARKAPETSPQPAAAAAANTRPRPVLVITDRDVGRAAPPPAEAGSEAIPAAGDADAEPSAADAPVAAAEADDAVVIEARHLEVSAFEVTSSPRGGLEVTGMLANRGERIVTDAAVSLSVRAVDGSEKVYPAIIADATLGIGGRSPFRILLPDVVALDEDDLRFDLRGKAVRPRMLGSAQTSPAEDSEAPAGDQR